MIITIAEDLAASETDQEAATSYIDRLYELAENPVRINSADEAELSRLFFLSDFQVKALADYTRTTGKIVSFNELSYIPGFDIATAEMIIPFASLDSHEMPVRDSVRIRNILVTNISLRSGNRDTASQGSPVKLLSRYKFTAGSLSGGLTVEKDQGEKFFSPGTVSPDFFSANLAYTGTGIVRRFIVGDYSARFGQGTNINSGISTGLSLTSQSYMSARNEVRPYTSTDENRFFRGIAGSLSIKKLEISFILSRHAVDATLGSSSGASEDCVESLYRSGTHNTSSLLQKRDAVTESAAGINASWNFRSTRVGLAWSENVFSLPLKPDPEDPGKLFSFKGESDNIFSLYYNSIVKKILLYGEVSANDLKRFAVVQGMSVRPSGRLTVNFLVWKYSPGYTSFNGIGPGGSSGSYAEQSVLGNFTFEAARHLFLSGGCIVQRFPWLKYRCSSPSSAARRELGLKYMPTDKLTIDCIYSLRCSMADSASPTGIPVLKRLVNAGLKLVVRYNVQDNLTLGTRLDFKKTGPPGSMGFLILGDASYRMRTIPLSLWLRYCVFRTDSYDSRIYTWENDLLYTFSVPSVYGTGSRFYIMAAFKLSGKAELRFKYGNLSESPAPGILKNTDEYRLQLKIAI